MVFASESNINNIDTEQYKLDKVTRNMGRDLKDKENKNIEDIFIDNSFKRSDINERS